MTNNWLIDNHHALQLRLLGLLLIFGVLFPGMCLLVAASRALAKRVMRRPAYDAQPLGHQATTPLGNR